jgi:hypothetical protein
LGSDRRGKSRSGEESRDLLDWMRLRSKKEGGLLSGREVIVSTCYSNGFLASWISLLSSSSI